MTEESLKAWETWTSFSVELRVVRKLLSLSTQLGKRLDGGGAL